MLVLIPVILLRIVSSFIILINLTIILSSERLCRYSSLLFIEVSKYR